ncbi:CPBP family glutamic-type intramembrane protease [Arcanobacterium pinnipediorum]|uniref:CPBP family glutamic-type intramembrane protease n=1 Tax=Arcanobacterium pinnipediorum TaxID=1503041 RepID=A0ABY5AJ41_9ACTO|nr:CPBP family glutamic-type intramembrane protease [Arcanobacterium pinnipediorum]USR79259.1 CPBP family glutamic-type intramembrane protease [Arcanobacterium pinnipediorum]
MISEDRLSFRDVLFGCVVFSGLASFALIHTQGFQQLGFISTAGFIGDIFGLTQRLPLPTQWTLSITIGALTEIICAALSWWILTRTSLSFTLRFTLAVGLTAVFRGIFFAPYLNVLSSLQWAGVAVFSTYYYWKYRRVWPLALSHALFNAIAFRPNDILSETLLGTLKTTTNDVVLPIIMCWAIAWLITRTLNHATTKNTTTVPKTALCALRATMILGATTITVGGFIAGIIQLFWQKSLPIYIPGVYYSSLEQNRSQWFWGMIIIGGLLVVAWYMLSRNTFPSHSSPATRHSSWMIFGVFFAIVLVQGSAFRIYFRSWGMATGTDFHHWFTNHDIYGIDVPLSSPSIWDILRNTLNGGMEELAYALILLALIYMFRMPSRLSIAVVLIFRVILHLYYATLGIVLWLIPDGIFAGIYVTRRGRILPLIIAHGLYDAILAIQEYIVRTDLFGHLRTDAIDRIWTPVTGIAGIIALTLAYVYYTHKRSEETTESLTATPI